MLPAFSSPEEASWLLRYWLDKPEERHKAAQQAREAVQDRTFTAHAKHLLRLLETKE
jgi:spore maturation protein CgeB